MFCHKCGAQIAEGAAFCHKCGTIVVYPDTSQPPLDTTAADDLNIADTPVQTDAPVNGPIADKDAFKSFVDNHVRTTTQYQTAEELLNSKVSLSFVWICLGISAILGAVTLNLVLLLVAAFFGYIVATVIGGIKRGRYSFRYSGNFSNSIDMDSLIQYLNQYLGRQYTCFHEWGIIKRVGSGIQGKAITAVSTATAESLGEIGLCTSFAEDQRQLAVICIRPDKVNTNQSQMEYFFGVEPYLMDGGPFSAQNTGFDLTFSRYKCLVKTAPILQAVMEYYLKHYQHN